MAGRQVTRQELDLRAAEAMLAVREALAKVEKIASFLEAIPVDAEGVDPLTLPATPTDPMMPTSTSPGHFGYTEDEAQLIRYVMTGVRKVLSIPENQAILKAGGRLTGLD